MRYKQFRVVAIPFLLLCLSGAVSASEQAGTFTQVEGDVKVFSHPSKTLQKDAGTHVLYEGEYYLVEAGKIGGEIEQGNIVRTAPNGKARVVFENGDQINVGPATAMRIFWNKEAHNPNTRMDLAYGKVRGIVEKGGPRGHLQIRTRTATMGVRGTDFFISEGGKDGGTEVSIMRGTVEVTPNAAHSKPIEVKQGFSADVPAPAPKTTEISAAPPAMQPVVELRQTTQQELQGIQKASTIAKAPESAPASAAVTKLESKAVAATLKDIKAYDPKMYAQLEARKPTSTDELNSHVVQALIVEAPKAPENHKPHQSEVEDLGQGAYEKYFKIQE